MRRTLMAAALLLLAAAPASAQVRAGLSEVNVSGHITAVSFEGETTTLIQLAGRYGYFISPALQLGATLQATKFEEVDLFGDVGAFAAYHFGRPMATTVPYFGAQAGVGFGGDDNPFNFGAFGGAKFFVGPAGAFTTEAFVNRLNFDVGDETWYGVRLGVSIFF